MEMIPLIDCTEFSGNDITDYLEETHDYGCHYDHTVIQLEDDGNVLAIWLKEQGYEFKYHNTKYGSFDLIALYGT
jgi:hypothetical protein